MKKKKLRNLKNIEIEIKSQRNLIYHQYLLMVLLVARAYQG